MSFCWLFLGLFLLALDTVGTMGTSGTCWLFGILVLAFLHGRRVFWLVNVGSPLAHFGRKPAHTLWSLNTSHHCWLGPIFLLGI